MRTSIATSRRSRRSEALPRPEGWWTFELRSRPAGAPAAANSTPRAILLSALTTLASFGALSLSSHPGTASMGLLLTLAIAITLFCILLLLPALLAVTERREAAGGPG